MKKALTPKPFIYFDNLKQWEIVSMMVYAAATLAVTLILVFSSPKLKQETIIMYTVLSQLGLYFALYTSLRNFKSYLVWFAFGVFHIILFFIFKGDLTLEMYRGNPTVALLNTVVLLLLYSGL